MHTYEITAVRLSSGPDYRHDHIVAVGIGPNRVELSLQTVVRDLRDPHGDRYFTYAAGERAAVYVRQCPHCTFRDYITTHPDSTTKNNLLSLPKL